MRKAVNGNGCMAFGLPLPESYELPLWRHDLLAKKLCKVGGVELKRSNCLIRKRLKETIESKTVVMLCKTVIF
jgi:hypothetical protein